MEREKGTWREQERDLKHGGAGRDQARTRSRTTRRPGGSGATWGHGKVNKTQVKNTRVRARGGKWGGNPVCSSASNKSGRIVKNSKTTTLTLKTKTKKRKVLSTKSCLRQNWPPVSAKLYLEC